MYLIKKNGTLINIALRGFYLTKKSPVNIKKQCLVYLRSPKHFNIGKQKVFSFNSKSVINYKLSKKMSFLFFKKNEFLVYLNWKILYINFRINSIKTTFQTSIKWLKW